MMSKALPYAVGVVEPDEVLERVEAVETGRIVCARARATAGKRERVSQACWR